MTVGKLDPRLALLLVTGVAAILVLRFGVYGDGKSQVVLPGESISVAEKRLERLRRVAASVAGKEAELKQVRAELAKREKGVVTSETAAQAQAHLLEVIRVTGQKEGIEMRGAEELKTRHLGKDYGEVAVTVTFTCAIEQLVNFLAALANEPQLLATDEIRVSTGDAKKKTVQVRLGLSGVVPRKLVPEKKGMASF